MNEWEAVAEWATRKADDLEALADHVRSLGKAERADGLMLAVQALRVDAAVFGRLANPDPFRLRLVR